MQLDVVGLDVTVGDPGFVQGVGGASRIGQGTQHLGSLERRRRLGQGALREVLHGIEEAVPVLTGIEEGDQVGRLDRGEDAKLAGGAPEAVVRGRPVQHLDDHQLHVQLQPGRRLRQVEVPVVPLAQPASELVVRDLLQLSLPVVALHRSACHLRSS